MKGYEVSRGKFVMVTPEELESADPERTRTIDIEDFVDLADVDPIFYDHPYYLAPGAGGAKPYRLLLEAMRETQKVAIAKVVIRQKEQLVALRPVGDVLAMSTMVFADEVVDPKGLDDVPDPGDVQSSDRELDIAKQLVQSLAGAFEPGKYHDTYREEVLALIERKAAGEDVVVQPEREEAAAPVPDLMSALKASLDAVRAREGDGGKPASDDQKPKRSSSGSRSKKTPAKTAKT